MSKKFYQILSLIIVILIFTNSLMNAEVSSSQSGFVLNIFQTVFGWFNITIESDTLSLMIRKLAHFLEFFVLGFTLLKGWGLKVLVNIFIIFLVASLDESIQLFSEGRAFSVLDIGIDFMGGIFGLLLVRLVFRQK